MTIEKTDASRAHVHGIVHTPGPWKPYAKTVSACNANGNDVRAECDPHGRVCQNASWADARLIALAPELLQACRDVLEAIEQADMGGEVLWIKRGSPIHESASDRLQDVIERATCKPVV